MTMRNEAPVPLSISPKFPVSPPYRYPRNKKPGGMPALTGACDMTGRQPRAEYTIWSLFPCPLRHYPFPGCHQKNMQYMHPATPITDMMIFHVTTRQSLIWSDSLMLSMARINTASRTRQMTTKLQAKIRDLVDVNIRYFFVVVNQKGKFITVFICRIS